MFKVFFKYSLADCFSLFSNIVDRPENNVYQSQENIYQLLRRDGKSTGHDQWEPPAYQGLAKGANEGTWGEGEVYSNPSMYQDLKKNETASNGGYMPAYHPLVKQYQSTVCVFLRPYLTPYISYSTG